MEESSEEMSERHSAGQQLSLYSLLYSDGQLVGDGHEHFEDGHEGRDLAEVAAAHHLRVHLQTLHIAACANTPANLVETAEDAGRKRLISQFVIQILETFGGVIKLAFRLRVCGGQLTALHQTAEGGLQDHVFGWDFFLLHTLGRKLLYGLYAGLLRGSGWHLHTILKHWSLRWETHHWSCNRCWRSVVLWQLFLALSCTHSRRVIPSILSP